VEHAAQSIAVEWANKAVSSRLNVTAGNGERPERLDAWKREQRKRLLAFAQSAAETFARRTSSVEGNANQSDAAVVKTMEALIAREVAAASLDQARIDAEIAAEVERR